MKKAAIITGASRGIGRAVPERLASDGLAVVVNYVSKVSEAAPAIWRPHGNNAPTSKIHSRRF
jgi:NAD(P)-dependent dehydrogenase (short-subunit alcohol dehydrogenase family)